MKTTQRITRSPHRPALLLAWSLAGALMMGAPAQAERGQPRLFEAPNTQVPTPEARR